MVREPGLSKCRAGASRGREWSRGLRLFVVAVGSDADPFDPAWVRAESGAVVGQDVEVLLEPSAEKGRDVAQDRELCTRGEVGVVEPATVAPVSASKVGQKAFRQVVAHERAQKSPYAPLETAYLLRHSGKCDVNGERAVVAAFAGQMGSRPGLIDAPKPAEDRRSMRTGREIAPRDRALHVALGRGRTVAVQPVAVAGLVTRSDLPPGLGCGRRVLFRECSTSRPEAHGRNGDRLPAIEGSDVRLQSSWRSEHWC